jgi:hypothetical protein
MRALSFIILLVLASGLVITGIYGTYRWKAGTRSLRARLKASRVPMKPRTIDFRELNGLLQSNVTSGPCSKKGDEW